MCIWSSVQAPMRAQGDPQIDQGPKAQVVEPLANRPARCVPAQDRPRRRRTSGHESRTKSQERGEGLAVTGPRSRRRGVRAGEDEGEVAQRQSGVRKRRRGPGAGPPPSLVIESDVSWLLWRQKLQERARRSAPAMASTPRPPSPCSPAPRPRSCPRLAQRWSHSAVRPRIRAARGQSALRPGTGAV